MIQTAIFTEFRVQKPHSASYGLLAISPCFLLHLKGCCLACENGLNFRKQEISITKPGTKYNLKPINCNAILKLICLRGKIREKSENSSSINTDTPFLGQVQVAGNDVAHVRHHVCFD